MALGYFNAMNIKRILSFTLLLITIPVKALSGDCVVATSGLAAMQKETISLINDLGAPLDVDVLVADNDFERASGFQHICADIIEQTRILFRYQRPIQARFHMNNVYAPLDIAFFDRDGKLLEVMLMETYSDLSRPLYGPGEQFMYALEAPKGWLRQNGLRTTRSYIRLVTE